MKKRRKVEKDQRMIKSRRVFERCGHRHKRKREKAVFFSLMPGIGRSLCVCIRYPLPKCQLGMGLKMGTTHEDQKWPLAGEEDRVGGGREREGEHIHHLPEMCVCAYFACTHAYLLSTKYRQPDNTSSSWRIM